MRRITDFSHENFCTFMTIPRLIILKMGNISGKVAEKIKALKMCPVTFFFTVVPFMTKYGKIRYSQTGHR